MRQTFHACTLCQRSYRDIGMQELRIVWGNYYNCVDFTLLLFSAINGAKEDVNFRRTLRISNSTAGNSSCTDNDIEQSALIVSKGKVYF